MKKLLALITILSISVSLYSQDSITVVSTSNRKSIVHTNVGATKLGGANSKRDQDFATGKANAALASAKIYADTRYNEGWKAGIKSADSLCQKKLDDYKKQMDTTFALMEAKLKLYSDNVSKANAIAEVNKLPLIQDGIGTKVTKVSDLLLQIDLKQ